MAGLNWTPNSVENGVIAKTVACPGPGRKANQTAAAAIVRQQRINQTLSRPNRPLSLGAPDEFTTSELFAKAIEVGFAIICGRYLPFARTILNGSFLPALS
jgi:hypothetical protein